MAVRTIVYWAEAIKRLRNRRPLRVRAVSEMNFRPADNGSMTDSGVSVASWPWSETGTSGTPKGVHFTKCCDFRRFPWRWVIFPVEVSLGLYLFTIFFLMQLLQQYAFQRIANDAFMEYIANHNVSNSSLFNVSQCWNQDRIVDLTSEDTFTHIQAETNRMNTIFFLSFFLPSSLMVLALGPLSDAFGRKTFMVLALVGQAVSSALSLAIVYFQLNLMVFVASECVSGVFGGAGAMYALTFAYASDATPKRWLTARIGLLEAAAFVAIAISSSTSFRWIEYTDCNFVPPSSLVVGIAVLAILFTLFIPESLPRHRRTKQLRQNRGGCIRELFNGLKIFFWPWYIEFGTFWRLWVLLLVMCIRVMNDIGLMQIISYFLHNKPLSWNYPLIGTFETVDSMARGLCLIVLLPILVVAKFSDIFIGLVGILFSIGCAIFIALLESTWEMFLGRLKL